MKKLILYFDPSAQSIMKKKAMESGEVRHVLSSRHNFVSEDEIVARVIDIMPDEDPVQYVDEGFDYYNIVDFANISAGQGIQYDDSARCYRAKYYGFVTLENSRLAVIFPITFGKDKIRVFYNIYPTKSGRYPSYNEVVELLHLEKIITIKTKDEYQAQIDAIDKNHHGLSRIVVAEGSEPVNGYNEYFLPLIDLEKKAGRIMEDGKIDYKEVGSIIQVQKNQEILKRVPEVKQENGYNVYGEIVSSVREDKSGFKKGANLLQSGYDPDIYVSGIEGCINVNNKTVDILPVAVIEGDVNLDSGNILFNGSVRITGSVLPGFKVIADSDIIVENDVEDAQLTAGGSIVVKKGVFGKESVKLVAGRDITARFMQNVKIEAGRNVMVEEYIINCDITSYDSVFVTGKSGKIIGGRVTAFYEIKAQTIGTQNETTTVLTVGRNLALEDELNRKRNEIKILKDRLDEITTNIKMQFGEEIFVNPKEYIKILPQIKKKTALVFLNNLVNSNASLKKLSEEARLLENQLKYLREPTITVQNRVYTGVLLNIKKSVKKIEQQIDNAKFYEDSLEKSIRFLSAN